MKKSQKARRYRSGTTTKKFVPQAQAVDGPKAKKKTRGRKILGKYRLIRKVASGGFADVYEAEDTIEGLRVALKLPHPGELDDVGTRNLLQEIRLLATLRHPHIAPLKDASFIDGRLALAMPLADTSLAQRARHRVSPDRAMKYARHLCMGLAYAHERGVIHCDIKPQNLLLTADDELRIADFGIAKIAQNTQTFSGSGAGTVGYFAPEQPHGQLSARSDVFSAALVLFELFSKQRPTWPFTWPLRGQARILKDFGPEVLKWLRGGLEIDPKHRYADGREFLDALPERPAPEQAAPVVEIATRRAPRVHLAADMASPEHVAVPEGDAYVFSHRAPGKRKGKSEDAVAVLRGKGATIVVLADGAGGYAHGEQAAGTLVRTFERGAGELRSLSADSILARLSEAHARIGRLGRRAGTTATIVVLERERFRAFYCGDSIARMYLPRGRVGFALMPHSPLGDAERSGLVNIDASTRKRERHVVSTLLGHADLRIEATAWFPYPAPDRATLVIASDGLWDNLPTTQIGQLATSANPATAAVTLADEMMSRAAADNGVADDMSWVLFRPRR